MNDCCPPLFGPDLDADNASELAAALKAVAEPNRLRLLHLIAASGEVCGCELTTPLGLSQPTVSHHLKILTAAGFLAREQRGKWAHFRIVPERLQELSAALNVSASV